MAQNAENIEAKLCAYVDGELDAKGRAEIEKHLQSNPQHRKLLESLAKTHRFVAELPREKAPPEILENLQGQLERAVLLGDVGGDESDGVMRISRWPQITSLAAIVMLTVGLGVILYFMLPPLSRQPDTYSIVQETPATKPVESPQPVLREAAAPKDHEQNESAAPAALMSRNTSSSAGERAEQGELDAIQVVRRRLSAAAKTEGSSLAQPQVLLVVNTDDPSTTQRQLLGYLQNNQIQWNAVGQEIATTRPDDSAAESKQQFASPAPPTTTPAQEMAATTQPSADSNIAQAQTTEPDDLIVCPNMTLQQANELAGALPMWRQGQRALVVSYFDSAEAPAASQPTSAPSPQAPPPAAAKTEEQSQTTQPAIPTTTPAAPVEPRLLQIGDRLHLQITLEADLELKKEMPIGETGTITLPLIGEIQAAGLSEAQLAQSIADAYRTRNISQNPQVLVSYLDPADQPPPVAVAIYLQNDSPQSTPTVHQPTTSPAEPTTAPAIPSQ
ncbi:MAG: polysaccharide biosynthesis/export family protein [Phycisphaerales bacterium]|jgi:hypothetical protein|nr:polysaccharide biosynthesis/export family protein [Phycisphaerales bacterium]